jgi:hypothetical protein
MQPQAKSTSICQTCIHVSECAHFQECQNQGRAIYHCENFDDRPVLFVVEVESIDDREQRLNPAKASIAYIKGRMKGLCLNCEQRDFCRYPVRDGGVWHCEDYC